MASSIDRLRKTRGIVRRGVASHVDYIVQQDAELTALNGKIAEATDDDALEQELEGAAEYNRKVSVTIHDNVELTKIEKFKYLLTYLIGDARRAIEGIRLSEANYDVAVSALVQRFGRPELLINEHIDQLLAFTPIRSSMDIDRLRELYDKVHFRVSALEALGVPQEQNAVVLNRVLLRCLPDDITFMYRQRAKELGQGSITGSAAESAISQGQGCQVKRRLEFLRIQIEIREEGKQGQPLSTAARRFIENTDLNPPGQPETPVPAALALTAETQPSATPACPLCDSRGHKVADCRVNLSAAEKRTRLRNARCCFRCGRRNHVARQCRGSRNLTCSTCNGRHLTVLCDVLRPADHTTPRSTPQVQAGQGALPTAVTASSGHSGETPKLDSATVNILSEKRYDAADVYQPNTWKEDEIGILVGSDAYWKVATGKIDESMQISQLQKQL
ncbi:uncharacterized protein LOC144166061 [Haemaphysalis longicornis]